MMMSEENKENTPLSQYRLDNNMEYREGRNTLQLTMKLDENNLRYEEDPEKRASG
jgi:hypothetical protein